MSLDTEYRCYERGLLIHIVLFKVGEGEGRGGGQKGPMATISLASSVGLLLPGRYFFWRCSTQIIPAVRLHSREEVFW